MLVSGGFATVHPNNKLTINVVEAAPLEDFSPEVRYDFSVPVQRLTQLRRLSAQTCRRHRGLLRATGQSRTSWRHRLRRMFTRRCSTRWGHVNLSLQLCVNFIDSILAYVRDTIPPGVSNLWGDPGGFRSDQCATSVA